jgi:hypothetical protein
VVEWRLVARPSPIASPTLIEPSLTAADSRSRSGRATSVARSARDRSRSHAQVIVNGTPKRSISSTVRSKTGVPVLTWTKVAPVRARARSV